MEQNENPLEGEQTNENNNHQEEMQPPITTMESLLAQEDLGLDFPKSGEIRTGIIVSISDEEILVSVGTKSEGVIPKKELEMIQPEDREKFQVGQDVTVYVINPEDTQGNLMLSHTRALEENDWQKAEELLKSGEVFEGSIQGYNKGGLIVPLGMLRGFVPGSQISLSRRMAYGGSTPDQRWGKMVGEPIATRVIEVDRERRRLILSERAALQEARELLKERLLDELTEGETRQGRVTSLADFGAFVNINGADGLVHLTEISWERINHPSEVLKVGQEVDVKVIDIDRDRKRIGLSIRQLQDDPWPQKVNHIQPGQLIEGKIVRLVKFGAFARLENMDIEGLIHISELSDQRIEHPKEVVSEGEVLSLRVINIDTKRRRIGLSLRKVDSPAYADLDWELALATEDDQPEATAMAAALEASDVSVEDLAVDEDEPAAEAPETVTAEQEGEIEAAEPAEEPAIEAVEEPAAETSEAVTAEQEGEIEAAEAAEEPADAAVEEPAAETPEAVAVEEESEIEAAEAAEEPADAAVEEPAAETPEAVTAEEEGETEAAEAAEEPVAEAVEEAIAEEEAEPLAAETTEEPETVEEAEADAEAPEASEAAAEPSENGEFEEDAQGA